MLTDMLTHKVAVQAATTSVGALGKSVSWGASTYYYACRVPLDVKTIASYQEFGTVVSDRYIFRGNVDIRIGRHRIIDGGTTYEPKTSAQKLKDATIVLVSEVI